jgi:hypothetical protein
MFLVGYRGCCFLLAPHLITFAGHSIPLVAGTKVDFSISLRFSPYVHSLSGFFISANMDSDLDVSEVRASKVRGEWDK